MDFVEFTFYFNKSSPCKRWECFFIYMYVSYICIYVCVHAHVCVLLVLSVYTISGFFVIFSYLPMTYFNDMHHTYDFPFLLSNNLSSTFVSLVCVRIYILGKTPQHLSFRDWSALLDMMLSNSICFPANDAIQFFMINIVLCVYITFSLPFTY